MKQYELIIFDWDGTLMDSEKKIVNCFRKAVADTGIDFPGEQAVRNIIGLGLKESLDVLLPDHGPETRSQVVERYREHFLHLDETEMPLFDGVEQGLEQLISSGYSLAIATGKARAGLDRVLRHTGLGNMFTSTRCSDEALSKPHPRMVLDILQDTDTAEGKAIVVGDTTYDMQMAKQAGVDALAVSYGVHDVGVLNDQQPVDCVDSFSSVISWFYS
jgi:phosphoglycolate phosphatase